MYSFTLTNVHSLYPIQPTQPKLVVKCKCNRRIYQQQCYTCLICPSYCCHYCTQIQFVDFQCRSCKKQYDATNKTNRCQFCFSCIQCSNVLKLSKDPQTKNYIFMCQFCYWSTKDIKLVQQKLEILLQKLNKYSTSIKDSQLKIYNCAYNFFKQTNLAIQFQNQTSKYFSNTKKNLKRFIQDPILTNKQQIQKLQKNNQGIIKRTGLDEPSEQYHIEFKYPQGLPLIAKKIRKCPDCKKPLTTIFRARTEDPKNAKLTGNDPKLVMEIKRYNQCIKIQKYYYVNILHQLLIKLKQNYQKMRQYKVNNIKKMMQFKQKQINSFKFLQKFKTE